MDGQDPAIWTGVSQVDVGCVVQLQLGGASTVRTSSIARDYLPKALYGCLFTQPPG